MLAVTPTVNMRHTSFTGSQGNDGSTLNPKRLKTSKSGHFDTGIKGDKNTVCLKNSLPTLSNFGFWWGGGGGVKFNSRGETKKSDC